MRKKVCKKIIVVLLLFIFAADGLNSNFNILNVIEIKAATTTVTRAQWIHSLVDMTGMKVEDNQLPDNYYNDVNKKTEYFEERLKVQHDMREQKLASYVLLKVEYSEMSQKEADEILRSKVRENDVWGISESKELYLMLVQMDKEALPIILARLKQAGLVCRQIDEELTGNNRTGENK